MSQGLGGGCAVLAGNWERVRLPRPAPASGSLRLGLALAAPRRDAGGGWSPIQALQWGFVCWPQRGGGAVSWRMGPHSLA